MAGTKREKHKLKCQKESYINERVRAPARKICRGKRRRKETEIIHLRAADAPKCGALWAASVRVSAAQFPLIAGRSPCWRSSGRPATHKRKTKISTRANFTTASLSYYLMHQFDVSFAFLLLSPDNLSNLFVFLFPRAWFIYIRRENEALRAPSVRCSTTSSK